MRITTIAGAALAAALALPTAAGAATLTRDADGGLTWTGKPGASSVVVSKDDDTGGVSLSSFGDDAASLPAGCTQSMGYPAVCTITGPVRVSLGDGDDSADVWDDLGVPVSVDGGAGDDKLYGAGGAQTLSGGPGNDDIKGQDGDDTLDGGDGNDKVDGGAGSDHVSGGAGNDTLVGDGFKASSPDVIDGGPGVDLVADDWSDSAHSAGGPANVTLDDGANDGFAGEGDDVRGVEKVYVYNQGTTIGTEGDDDLRRYAGPSGGPSTVEGRGGNDVLMSDKANDKLDGGAGDDRVVGGFGDDTLVGGPGRDTLIGDTDGDYCGIFSCTLPYGNDTIDARDGEVDSVVCGVGTDTVSADPVDVVAPDCENVQRSGAGGGTPPGGVTIGDEPKGPSGTRPPASCKVPKKLKGLTLTSARKKLRAAHCATIKTKKVKSRSVRKGRVVSAARKGRVVTVSISRGR
jgi:Ca2+-binding RTX toxin-like protein